MSKVPLIINQTRTPGGVLNAWTFSSASDVVCTGTNVTLINTTITLAGNSRLLFWYTEPNLIKSSDITNPSYQISIPGVSVPLDTNHIFYGIGSNTIRTGISWLTYSDPITTGGLKTFNLLANRYDTGSVTFGFQGRTGKLIIMEMAV